MSSMEPTSMWKREVEEFEKAGVKPTPITTAKELIKYLRRECPRYIIEFIPVGGKAFGFDLWVDPYQVAFVRDELLETLIQGAAPSYEVYPLRFWQCRWKKHQVRER